MQRCYFVVQYVNDAEFTWQFIVAFCGNTVVGIFCIRFAALHTSSHCRNMKQILRFNVCSALFNLLGFILSLVNRSLGGLAIAGVFSIVQILRKFWSLAVLISSRYSSPSTV